MISDKRGMMLLESLILFMIVAILIVLCLGMMYEMKAMNGLHEKGLKNDKMQAIWEKT